MTTIHEDAWADLRRRLRFRDGLVVAYLPVTALAWVLSDWLGAGDAPVLAVAMGLMLAMAVSTLHLSRLGCPRCGERWLMNRLAMHFSPAACGHCHQQRDAPLS
jgi:ribosomal protein S27AE